MNTSFKKVVHFSKLIKTPGRLREFNFRKNNALGSTVFDVDTADDRGNRIQFNMIKEGNEWSLQSKNDLPVWITENKEQLIKELEEGILEN